MRNDLKPSTPYTFITSKAPKANFRCCDNQPSDIVSYSVAGEIKSYLVCSDCIKLECFSKYIIKKTPISDIARKKFQNEISDETVENEIINGKLGEMIEQCENLSEQIEEESLQFSSKNKRSTKL